MLMKKKYILLTALFTLGLCILGCTKQLAVKHYVTALSMQNADFEQDAILELQEVVQLDPEFTLAHSLLGDLYEQMGDHEMAANAYEKACELDPWEFSDHFKLGKVYQTLERFLEAIKVFSHAITLSPQDIQANYSLGVCYYQVEDYEQAEKYCKKASQLDPANDKILASLGDIHGKTGDDYKSINFYKQALELDADQPDIMVKLGMVYLKMDRFSPGKLILEKAVQMAPENPNTHTALGYCLFKTGNTQDALTRYQATLDLDSRNTVALNGKGACKMTLYLMSVKAGSSDEELANSALENWHQSLEIDPNQEKIRTLINKYTKTLSLEK